MGLLPGTTGTPERCLYLDCFTACRTHLCTGWTACTLCTYCTALFSLWDAAAHCIYSGDVHLLCVHLHCSAMPAVYSAPAGYHLPAEDYLRTAIWDCDSHLPALPQMHLLLPPACLWRVLPGYGTPPTLLCACLLPPPAPPLWTTIWDTGLCPSPCCLQCTTAAAFLPNAASPAAPACNHCLDCGSTAWRRRDGCCCLPPHAGGPPPNYIPHCLYCRLYLFTRRTCIDTIPPPARVSSHPPLHWDCGLDMPLPSLHCRRSLPPQGGLPDSLPALHLFRASTDTTAALTQDALPAPAPILPPISLPACHAAGFSRTPPILTCAPLRLPYHCCAGSAPPPAAHYLMPASARLDHACFTLSTRLTCLTWGPVFWDSAAMGYHTPRHRHLGTRTHCGRLTSS